MRSTESTGSDDLDALFASAVAPLAEGNLTFPSPFDLAASAALAANDDHGRLAVELFKLLALRDVSYRVTVHATAPGVPDREVVNTTVAGAATLVALLDGLLDEITTDPTEGDPSGG